MEDVFPQARSKFASAVALLAAVVMAAGLFLIIPLTQSLNAKQEATLTYREMVLATPPPPPKIPPPPETRSTSSASVDPEPPQMENQVEDIPVQRLELSLRPGMGVALNMGMPSMPSVGKVDTVAEIEKIFNFDELAQPPSVINGSMIRVDYPPELTRRGVREATVVMEITIDKSGRVSVNEILSSTYEHPRLQEAARRAAEQIRFTVTKVNGRAVTVRGRFPMTLQSPR